MLDPFVVLTFMKSMTCQSLKLCKVMHQVAVLVFGLRCHVVELPYVSLPDAQSEDLNTSIPQSCSHRPRVSPVGVAISDQENNLGGVGSGVPQDLLLEEENMKS